MKIHVTVDSVTEGKVSLLLRTRDKDGEEYEIPMGVFPEDAVPEGTQAGDILSIRFEKDEEETLKARERVRKIHEALLSKQSK